jgi:hypothetical protein
VTVVEEEKAGATLLLSPLNLHSQHAPYPQHPNMTAPDYAPFELGDKTVANLKAFAAAKLDEDVLRSIDK